MGEEQNKEQLHSVRQVLRHFSNPSHLGKSEWITSCLVAQLQKEKKEISDVIALQEVFGRALELLRQESELYADILHARYWKGRSVIQLQTQEKSWPWSERRIYQILGEAVERFTNILLSLENDCLAINVSSENKQEEEEVGDTQSTFDSSRQGPFNVFAYLLTLAGLSDDDIEDLKDEISIGPQPRWPGLFLALWRKFSERWTVERALRASFVLMLLLITWQLTYPPLRWQLLPQNEVFILVLVSVAGGLILPLLIGASINTKDDEFWKEQLAEKRHDVRVYTHIGAAMGFHVGYAFIFFLTIIIHHLWGPSLPLGIELLFCLSPLLWGYAAAGWVPYNVLRAYDSVTFTQRDAPIALLAFLFGPFIGGLYWFVYPYFLDPFIGLTMIAATFFLLAALIIWQRKQGNEVIPAYIWAGIGGIGLILYTLAFFSTWINVAITLGLTVALVDLLKRDRIRVTNYGMLGLLAALVIVATILYFNLTVGRLAAIGGLIAWVLFGRKYIWFPVLGFWGTVALSTLATYLASVGLLTDVQASLGYIFAAALLLWLDHIIFKPNSVEEPHSNLDN